MGKLNSVEVGNRIREIRKKYNVTMRDLAEALDISEQYMGEIERGKHFPSLDKLVIYLNQFDVSADYILYGTLPEKVPSPEANDLTKNLPNLDKQELQAFTDMLEICHQKQVHPLEKGYFNKYAFSKRIKSYREKAGFTPQELAKAAGLTQSHIQKIEHGQLIPTLKTLDKIAKALQIPVDYIIANSTLSGNAIIMRELLDSLKKLPTKEQKIALKILQVYVDEKKNDE